VNDNVQQTLATNVKLIDDPTTTNSTDKECKNTTVVNETTTRTKINEKFTTSTTVQTKARKELIPNNTLTTATIKGSIVHAKQTARQNTTITTDNPVPFTITTLIRDVQVPVGTDKTGYRRIQTYSESDSENDSDRMTDRVRVPDSLTPKQFSGLQTDNPNEWISKIKDWLTLTGQQGREQGAAAIGLLLTGMARLWYESLPVGDKSNPDRLLDAFRRRYINRAENNWRDCAEFAKMQQNCDESVEDFMTRVIVEAKRVYDVIDERQVQTVILQGMKPAIRQHVVQHENLTLDNIRRWGKLAEQNSQTDTSAQVAKETLQRIIELTDRLDTTRITADSDKTENQTRTDRTNRQYDRPTTQYRPQYRPIQYRPYERNVAQTRPQFNQRTIYGQNDNFCSFPNSQRVRNTRPQYTNYNGEQNQFSMCQNCGRSPNHSPEACLARNLVCRGCGIMGHFARVCRKSRQQPRQNTADTGYSRPAAVGFTPPNQSFQQ
jgi:hypothetical protein